MPCQEKGASDKRKRGGLREAPWANAALAACALGWQGCAKMRWTERGAVRNRCGNVACSLYRVDLCLVMIDLSIETAAAPGVPAVGPHQCRIRQGGVTSRPPDRATADICDSRTAHDAGFTHRHDRVPGLCVGGTRHTVTGCSPSAEPPSAHRGRSRWGSRRERMEVRTPARVHALHFGGGGTASPKSPS